MSDRLVYPVDIVKASNFPRPFKLDPDDVIVGVLVVIKVVDGEGLSGVAMCHDDVDWVTRTGMLDYCLTTERHAAQHRPAEDD